MPIFNVRYFDSSKSEIVQERADSGSETELRGVFASEGRTLLSVQPVARQARVSLRPGPGFDIAGWCRELSTLLKAGMTVVEAIETLHAQAHGEARERIQAQLLRFLREGQSLSRAMQSSGEFPAVLIAGVTASERTSTLTGALEDFLRYDEMLQRLRRQVIGAAIYPAIVVTLGALVSLFLLLYVIPRFSRMYVDFHGTLSWPTQVLMAISHAMQDRLPIVMAVLITGIAVAAWAWRRGLILTFALQTIDKIGPLQRQWDNFRRAKLYQSLALMFRGGYTLDEALVVCQGMELGKVAALGIATARDDLARGKSVVAAFGRAQLADAVAVRLLAVGERSGSFDSVLQTIADRHAAAFATFVERATRIIEPILLLIVALVVGGIVVMMYMPIFDIANGVQ